MTDLKKIGEFDVVTVHNPLSDDWTGKVARSVPAVLAEGPVEQIAREKYGVTLTNPNSSTLKHVNQTVSIKSGQSLRIPGPLARVLVTQLVKEMMQREGKVRGIANPDVFQKYVDRVVVDQSSMLGEVSSESIEDKLQKELDDLNKDDQHEEAFPDAEQAPESDSSDGGGEALAAKIPKAPSGKS